MATKKKKKTAETKSSQVGVKNQQPPDTSRGEELLAWTVVPMRKEPRKAKIFIASTLGFLGLVYVAYDWDLRWVGLAALLMVAAFNSFIFPSRYRFTSLGVEQRAGISNVFKPWTSFARVIKFSDGVQLNHGRGKLRNRLNPGIFIYFGDNNSEEVLKIVEQNIKQEATEPKP